MAEPNIDIFSFLAIWFNNLKKTVFKVEVTNNDKEVTKKLALVLAYLQELRTKEIPVIVKNQKEMSVKSLETRLDDLISSIKALETSDNKDVEKLLKNLISATEAVRKVEVLNQPKLDVKIPERMSVSGEVKVSNFPQPKEFSIDFKDVIEGLKGIIEEIRDMKLENTQHFKGLNTFAGMAGSRSSVSISSIAEGDNNIGNVDVVSTVLPTGASTSAKQDTQTGYLTTLAGAVSGSEMQVDVVGSLPAGNNNIGDVDIASGTITTITNVVHVDDNSGTLTVDNAGLTSLNGAISGSEVQVDIVGALPAGSNAIGKLAANSGVDIGDVTVNNATTTPVYTFPSDFEFAGVTTHAKKYYTNAGAVTDGVVWSPAAGKRWYVTDIIINVSAAATVTLEDDLTAGDSAVFKAELAANSGIAHSFITPLFSGEDAADLLITTSAGNVYVTVTGYEI